MYNVELVSGVQQSESVIQVSTLFSDFTKHGFTQIVTFIHGVQGAASIRQF